MRGFLLVLAGHLLLAFPSPADDRILDWVKVTDRAGWQPRDSGGEAVYKDRLWLLGGWYDSYTAPPRDVWGSPDGKAWELVTREAPWKYSDLPMTVVFNDRMWLMGGWYNGRLPGHGASHEVWSSSDGRTWDRMTDRAGWSPRLAAGAVAFKGRLWILGGRKIITSATTGASRMMSGRPPMDGDGPERSQTPPGRPGLTTHPSCTTARSGCLAGATTSRDTRP